MPLVIVASPASGGKGGKGNRPKVGAASPAPNNPRDDYNRKLWGYVTKYLAPTAQEVMQSYIDGATVDEVEAILNQLEVKTADKLEEIALRDLQSWFFDIDGYSKKRFEASLRRTMGIDARSILDPILANETRQAAITENIALIREMPGGFYGDVYEAIVADYRGDGFPDDSKSLAERIQNIGGISKNRASLIARDQTAKLNSVLAEARQTDAGITHYIWRTAGDRRVVGKPGGAYPPEKLTAEQKKVHGNHYERDGKMFAWNKPPPDGAPGQSLNCRCIAAPVIKPNDLKVIQ